LNLTPINQDKPNATREIGVATVKSRGKRERLEREEKKED